MKWLIGIALGAIGVVVTSWFTGFLGPFVKSPERTRLALANAFADKPAHSEDSFRIVLCWLENDYRGEDTKNVARALTNLEGIELVRTDEIVSASGAKDAWSNAMKVSARSVLQEWDADLAIVGLVKRPGEVLSLWLVPRSGEGTLERGDRPYQLEAVTLGTDFHADLRAQLTVQALAAVSPVANTESRSRALDKGLREAADKLSTLLRGDAIRRPEYRAALQAGLGTALSTLGKREIGTERLRESVAAYRAALDVFTRERTPEQWSLVLNDLGVALVALAEREGGTERLEEAIAAYRMSLVERARARVPLDWAMTQNNLGVALATIGERERSTARLEEAIVVYRVALEEYTRERAPLDWATTQNNLGNALARLGKIEGGTTHLENAVSAYRASLEERTWERVPLQWALTMSNLAAALVTLGKVEKSVDRILEGAAAFREGTQRTYPRARRARMGQDADRPWRYAERAGRA